MTQQNVKNTYLLATTVCVWLMFSFSFVVLRNTPTYEEVAGYLSLFGESGLDLIAAIFCYNLMNGAVSKNHKILFLFFLISFLSAFVADGTYNFLLNLALFKYDNDFKTTVFELPFVVFLLFQSLAWAWLLYTNKSYEEKPSKLAYLPYYIISAMILGVFLFGIQWKIEYTSVAGAFQVIDTLLEVAGFALATICLARMQSPYLKYSAIGYLLIVSSDIIIRYHVVSGLTPYLSSLELTWILGLALMVLGFFLSRIIKMNCLD